MKQLSLPFKNTDIEEWNWLMRRSGIISFDRNQSNFIRSMVAKHRWSYCDRINSYGVVDGFWGGYEAEDERDWDDDDDF